MTDELEIVVRYLSQPEAWDVLDLGTEGTQEGEELYFEVNNLQDRLRAVVENGGVVAEGISLEEINGGFRLTLKEGTNVYISFELPKEASVFASKAQNGWRPGLEGYALMRLNEALYSTTKE